MAIRYAGYQYDGETGLYYLNSRYYDSKIARFLSEDTYRGQANDSLSLNLYTYCHNEPIMYWDPTGHWEQGDEELNDDAKARIIALTNAYYAASTKEEKQKIHKEADSIRNSSNSKIQKDTLVEIENVAGFNNALSGWSEKGGFISSQEWNNAMKALNATVTNYREESSINDIKVSTLSRIITIGKADIDVRIKTAVSMKDTNIFSTGSPTIITTTHYSAYIFYLPEWKNEMQDDRKRLAAGKNVSAVVINTHANHSGLRFSSENEFTSSDILGLDDKKIDKFILYGCNAGHLDHREDNPAAQFSRKVYGAPVIASDGTVDNGVRRILWIFGSYAYESKNDRSFRRQRSDSSKRDNEGWIRYQYTDGKITTSDSLGKRLTLTQMLLK